MGGCVLVISITITLNGPNNLEDLLFQENLVEPNPPTDFISQHKRTKPNHTRSTLISHTDYLVAWVKTQNPK